MKKLSRNKPKDKQRKREIALLFGGLIIGGVLGVFGNLFTNWFYDYYKTEWWMPHFALVSLVLLLSYIGVMTFYMTRWLRQAQ